MNAPRMHYTFGPLERRGILGPIRLGQALGLSLATLIATAGTAVIAGITLDSHRALLIIAIAILIILRHHENIRRLIGGTESRISVSKS